MPPYLGLPSIPSDLKAIAPYLQRADETKSQDPIISYWCAYYAAQIGISLKAASAQNRAFLSALLTKLETLRISVGSSDAVTVDGASSAYVENFALRVFASADNEDRGGVATLRTAKKFVAAATFFDVLNVFEDRGPWETHEEKVRYSKWRAADINKALREGRQPTPAPGVGEPAETTTTTEPTSASSVPVPPISPPAASTDAPEARVVHEQEEPYSTSVLPAVSAAFGEGDSETSFEIHPSSAPAPINAAGDPQAQHPILPGSPELPLPPPLPQHPPTVDVEQGRGRSTSISAAPLTPSPTTRPQRSISPTHFVSRDSPPPPPPASYNIADAYPSAPPLPPLPPSAPYVQIPAPSAPPLIEMSPPPAELTPGQIAKAQRHCRFAISALDYEDAEQARKELRAALAIIGG